MEIWSLLLLALGLSADAFAVSISKGVLCKENNVKFIGYGADQKDLEPSLAITSCIADTGMAIESVIGKVGTDEFGSSWMPGMADGVVFIGSFGDNVPQDVQDQVNQVVEQIKNGELVVENKDSE